MTLADGSQIRVRRASPNDAPALGVVGPAAYAEAYASFWDQPSAYLRQLATFGEAAFRACLEGDAARVWVAEAQGDILGFLIMNPQTPDPVTNRPGGAELARVYVLGPARRLGVGRRLLCAAIEEAAAAGCAYVWLHVLAAADWARRAYVRWGFSELGATEFTGGVADGFAGMIVMSKAVGQARRADGDSV